MFRLLAGGFLCLFTFPLLAQTSRIVVIGSSTAAGEGANPLDSSWVSRINHTYKRNSGQVDSTYNLGVSGLSLYQGLPDSFRPTGGQPLPDGEHNVSKAVALLRNLPDPSRGIILVNFPTNGYNIYSINEIMTGLQLIYDSATRYGNRCYISTTQPRFDTDFNTPAIKNRLAVLKDSINNRFGRQALNFWDPVVNPADTTILGLYSAGDGVHLNNGGHRMLYNVVLNKNILSNVILPVVWGEFKISAQEKDIELSWTTLQENNTGSFIIETSQDGVDYTELSRVPAHRRTTDVTAYHFTHHNQNENKVQYYRIRQSDLDGRSSYSDVKSIKLLPTGQIASLLVNPIRQLARLQVNKLSEATLVDLSGKLLLRMKLSPGIHSINLGAYRSGRYQLILHTNVHTQTIPIIKL